VAFTGKVWDVRRDQVDLGGGSVVTRDVVEHDGAVLVLAVREDRGGPEVLLIRQYRHPVAAEDWELPAGLLDVEGEDPLQAARRELAEEADLRAEHWEQLLSFTPSPGSLGEVITAFVATGLSEVPAGERHVREHEEAGMPVGWVRVPDVVAAVLGGQVRNGPMIVGVLALAARLH
jgi:ADP-ribose pyrophosphatase